jgi:FAD/FMN-containing dehydrogenase
LHPLHITFDFEINHHHGLQKLQSLLPGKIIPEGFEGYDTHISCFNFRSARQRPLCIVKIASAEDVSKALKALSEHPETPFVIKSGGHSPHADDANTDTGVLIDLKGLNTIAQSNTNEEVYELGAGGSWGKVYEVLSKSKRAASGSRETEVGIGGLITGGMY